MVAEKKSRLKLPGMQLNLHKCIINLIGWHEQGKAVFDIVLVLTCTFETLPDGPFSDPSISRDWYKDLIDLFTGTVITIHPLYLPYRRSVFPLRLTRIPNTQPLEPSITAIADSIQMRQQALHQRYNKAVGQGRAFMTPLKDGQLEKWLGGGMGSSTAY